MGVSTYGKTIHQLWEEKLGLGEEPPENNAMRYGKEMEVIAREAYQELTGYQVSPAVIFHPTILFMGASLDGLSADRRCAVEIKCTNLKNHEMARAGKIPEEFYPQVQHQLSCLGMEEMHYFSYFKGDKVLLPVFVNKEYLEELHKKEAKFWDMVVNFEEPELCENDYEKISNKELAEELRSVLEALDTLSRRRDEIKARLISEANGRNLKGHGIAISKIVRKGSINYKAIPGLLEVDYEIYRKEPVTSWRINLC
jgi:putative phage-type endonuclease